MSAKEGHYESKFPLVVLDGEDINGNPRNAPSFAVPASLRAGITIIVCVGWTCVSSLAILVNKNVMVDVGFRFPTTVAFMGLLTTTVLSYVTLQLLDIPQEQRTKITPRYYLTQIMPTGFLMALSYLCGNSAYLYLTVAFIQMLKAFCPVITMLLLFAARLERATPRLVASVGLISLGVAMASYGEVHMSMMGLTMMLTSVVSESMRLVMIQYVLAAQSMHPMEGLLYISSACTLCLSVLAVALEWRQIVASAAYLMAVQHPGRFLVAALAGFGVNTLAIMVIKLASSLTLKVLGTVKDAALVTVSVVFLHEAVSPLQGMGYSLSLVGFVAYNLIKGGHCGMDEGAAQALGGEQGEREKLLPVSGAHSGGGDVEFGQQQQQQQQQPTVVWEQQPQLQPTVVLVQLAILVNKNVMVDVGFKFPTTVAFMGLLTTTVLSYITLQLLNIPQEQRTSISSRYYMTQVMPTGFLMALTFVCGNSAYLYLTVAFVQMLKAFCPVITMLLLFAARLERATPRLVASVLLISLGVAMASYGEMHMSILGLTVMLTSVVSESMRLVMTQYVLVAQSMHPVEGLLYISSACTLCLMALALVFEWRLVFSSGAYLLAARHPGRFMVCALAGFGVNALAILVIKLASSLTLKVLGTVKDAALITIGVVFLHELVSPLQLSGYLLSLVGFVAYNLTKAGFTGNAGQPGQQQGSKVKL